MPPTKITYWSLLNALGTLAYVGALVFFMSHGKQWLGQPPEYLMGMTMLTVFILSAAITGSLVLGRPILMYLDGAKKDALKLFGLTLGWIFVFLCFLLVLLVVIR